MSCRRGVRAWAWMKGMSQANALHPQLWPSACITPSVRGSTVRMYEMAGAVKMLVLGNLLTHCGDAYFKT